MAKVFFPDHLARYTDGVRQLDVAASSFRELVVRLDARFPGIAEELLGKVAVAIDGDIVHDPFLEPIGRDAEVYFLHRIEGG
jgi:hypothetical protein